MSLNSPCHSAALRLLAGRDYATGEMRRKLLRQGFSPDTIDIVVSDLQERGYLNDTALCDRYADKLAAEGKYGVHGIAAKLKQRGFSTAAISLALAKQESQAEEDRAQQLAKRRFKTGNRAEAAKAYRFLMSRGFSSSTVRKVIERLFTLE